MAKSERAENLQDILDGKRIPAGKSDAARGEGITADNTRAAKLPDPRPLHGEGRHRDR